MGIPINGSTETGGAGAQFPSTSWSMVRAAQDSSTPQGRNQLERLASLYWKPVYHFIRRSWSKSNEDAKDLTQAFFARFLESGDLPRLGPEHGSLRAYLKTALSHFLVDQQRRETAAKRGGTVPRISIEPSQLAEIAVGGGSTPDQDFDRQWTASFVADAVQQLGAALEAEGREIHARVFKMYYLLSEDPAAGGEEGGTSTYPEVAEKLGLKPHDVKNYLGYARRRLRTLLEEKIRETTASESEAAAELRFILGT
jgi:RNA polymerase sigma-70 factor (ECF subfamily)